MTLPCTFTDRIKQQRLMLSSAIIVGLALILLGHAPIVPTLLGCLIVAGWSLIRPPR
jgi:hypothetical protein